MSAEPPASASDWLGLWEAAAEAVTGRAPFEEVYTGPVWEGPVVESPVHVRVWKVSILQRRPGGGAEHWGHLFLVEGGRDRPLSLEPHSPVPGLVAPRTIETLPGAADLPFDVRIRPVTEGTSDRLRAFGQRFQAVAEDLFRKRRPGTA